MDELLAFTGDVLDRLPSRDDHESFRFDRDTVPELPASLTTSEIKAWIGGTRTTGSGRSRACICGRSTPPSGHSGVLVVAILFQDDEVSVDVALESADDVRALRVVAPHREATGSSLELAVSAFDYTTELLERHPWHRTGADPRNLPRIYFQGRREPGHVDEFTAPRDRVAVFDSSPKGMGRLAQLLLDAGDPDQSPVEYVLESEAGFRGVGPLSAELVLWLPGSVV